MLSSGLTADSNTGRNTVYYQLLDTGYFSMFIVKLLTDFSCHQIRRMSMSTTWPAVLCRFMRSHSFGDWVRIEEKCEEIRRCRRDGAEERRSVHMYGDWQWSPTNPCEKVWMCSACSQISVSSCHNHMEVERSGMHITDFQSWRETIRYECSRCGDSYSTSNDYW